MLIVTQASVDLRRFFVLGSSVYWLYIKYLAITINAVFELAEGGFVIEKLVALGITNYHFAKQECH